MKTKNSLNQLPEWGIWNVKFSEFLGAFAKLRKATISFVTSVRLSLCLPVWNNLDPTESIFMNSISEYFSKIGPENVIFIKIGQE